MMANFIPLHVIYTYENLSNTAKVFLSILEERTKLDSLLQERIPTLGQEAPWITPHEADSWGKSHN